MIGGAGIWALRRCPDGCERRAVWSGCDICTHSFFSEAWDGARMGKFISPKAAPMPKQQEVVKAPEVIDTSETGENTVKARAKKRYGMDKTFTAKGNGGSVFGQAAGASYRKTLG